MIIEILLHVYPRTNKYSSRPADVGLTKPELVEFKIKYASYVESFNNDNHRPPSQKGQAASIYECIQPKLLHSLCILGVDGANSAEKEAFQTVEVWFNRRLQHQSKELSAHVTDAVESVDYNMPTKDSEGAPETVVLQILSALDKRNE